MTKKRSVKRKRISGGAITGKMLNRLAHEISFLLNHENVTNLVLNNTDNVDASKFGVNQDKYSFESVGATTFLSFDYKGYNVKIEYPEGWPHNRNNVFITAPNDVVTNYTEFITERIVLTEEEKARMVDKNGIVQWNNITPQDFQTCVNYTCEAINRDAGSSQAHAREVHLPVAIATPSTNGDANLPIAESGLFADLRLEPSKGGGRRVKKRKTKKRKYTKRRK